METIQTIVKKFFQFVRLTLMARFEKLNIYTESEQTNNDILLVSSDRMEETNPTLQTPVKKRMVGNQETLTLLMNAVFKQTIENPSKYL
jgi:hypothetical protein